LAHSRQTALDCHFHILIPGGCGAIYTFTATPIYKATAQVLIEKSTFSGLSAIEMMLIDTSGPEFYKTQQKILESRTLAREVNKRLNLSDYPNSKRKKVAFFTLS